MAEILEMTQLSPTMTEGVLVEWLKKEGDLIKAGDPIASVETDKAVMELESFGEGILLATIAKKGERLPVGAPVAIIGNPSDDISALLEKAKAFQKKTTPESQEKSNPSEISESPVTDRTLTQVEGETEEKLQEKIPIFRDGRVRISPLAKKLAQKHGIDPATIKGSGPLGRIVRRDIEQALKDRTGTPKSERKADTRRPISMMRQVIAKRLSDSKSQVPHFYLTRKIKVKKLLAKREEANRALRILKEKGQLLPGYPEKLSVNDYIVRATALALRLHPEVNAQWGGDSIILKGNIDIGVAVAMEDGLLTPIVKNADQKDIYSISVEIKNLAEKARKRKLQSEEYLGGSFTISNLGMYGIDYFQAIINAPEAALLAVGKSTVEPVYYPEKGIFEPEEILTVTLSCDHRVVDGAKGAEFLQSLAFFLENPELL